VFFLIRAWNSLGVSRKRFFHTLIGGSRSSVDEDGLCAPAAKIFRRYALSRGIAFEVAFLVGVGGPNKRTDVIDGAYQPAFDQNTRQRIKRKLQAKRGVL
jgi:hypothetical protein